MIIDFTTINPRWGTSGISFESIEEFVFVLGFLTNIRHYSSYRGKQYSYYDKSVEIQVEGNYVDGAWAKECRIHYLKDLPSLQQLSQSLSNARSAGRQTHGIQARINSNRFINHLISEYGFKVSETGKYSEYVTPPDKLHVKKRIESSLFNTDTDIYKIFNSFEEGYNL
ncbi:hypothetical protein HMPREF2655_05135 [Streptococcus sp. HMSC066F01]|jgi:hypothetical protein|uniref:hypothetical protein n=1 Tax=unclassified Streptococcus TaxID=2608887 RepID=UPI0008A8B5AB|nr:hypothetical protein [Streptococcus sp. HMSC066F01]OHQ21441.1 hypothetical protein HMPREF2655_05135 [Streptococcus sp. HMSC066F01]